MLQFAQDKSSNRQCEAWLYVALLSCMDFQVYLFGAHVKIINQILY